MELDSSDYFAVLIGGLGGGIAVVGLALLLAWRLRRRGRLPLSEKGARSGRSKHTLSKQELRRRVAGKKRR